MIAKKMMEFVEGGSAIRAMFEEGARLAKEFGEENVFDFSLGNPNIPAPKEVNQAIKEIVTEEESTFVHGYTRSNSGYEDVREIVANKINKEQGTDLTSKNIIMTVGAASGLNVVFKTLLDPEDEVISFAPYFVEYGNFVANYLGKLKVVPANTSTFQPDLQKLEEIVSNKTKAVIINSPNNPTGVIYSEEVIKELSDILRRKEEEYGHDIYLICDEPYRELAYDGAKVPYPMNFYDNAIIVYSWSKSLSLPGERIGYIAMANTISDFDTTILAATMVNRVLGYVNAPSLIQRTVARCIDSTTDIAAYDKNRQAIYDGLREIGYECTKPEGAFYLFVKSPIEDDKAFVNMAKKHNILIVPGTAFACPGYVRIAYCVSHEKIIKSLPRFKALWEEVQN